MSSRYVWQRYAVNTTTSQGAPTNRVEYTWQTDFGEPEPSAYVRYSSPYDGGFGYGPVFGSSGTETTQYAFDRWDSDTQTEILNWDGSVTIPANKYFGITSVDVYEVYKVYLTTAQTELSTGRQSQPVSPSVIPLTFVRSKGAANGTVSNSSSATYPPRDYVSKSARIWPYSVPFMRCSGRSPEYATKPLELDALSR